jgi:hypothetical protein
MKPPSFTSAEYADKKHQTHKKYFLAELNAVVQWTRHEALIEQRCPGSGRENSPPNGEQSRLRWSEHASA